MRSFGVLDYSTTSAGLLYDSKGWFVGWFYKFSRAIRWFKGVSWVLRYLYKIRRAIRWFKGVSWFLRWVYKISRAIGSNSSVGLLDSSKRSVGLLDK